jgi:hypothetical protein
MLGSWRGKGDDLMVARLQPSGRQIHVSLKLR